MNISIMSADDLMRYARPQSDLERALLDELADIMSILAEHEMTPLTLDKDLTDNKNRFDALAERYEALEDERDKLLKA